MKRRMAVTLNSFQFIYFISLYQQSRSGSRKEKLKLVIYWISRNNVSETHLNRRLASMSDEEENGKASHEASEKYVEGMSDRKTILLDVFCKANIVDEVQYENRKVINVFDDIFTISAMFE